MALDTIATSSGPANANDDRGMPPQLVFWGIIVGFVLVIVGTSILVLYPERVPLPMTSLTVCIGFGLVLAAFGSRAQGAWGGFAVVGAAALSIVLFLLLQRYLDAPPGPVVKRGQIGGDFSRVADLRIVDEDPLYTRRDRNTGAIRFLVLDKRFQTPRLRVQVDTTEKGDGREFFEMVAASKSVEDLLNAGGAVSWTFDYAQRRIKDGSSVVFSIPEELDEQDVRSRRQSSGAMLPTLSVVAVARAMEAPPPEQSLAQLSDDDTAIRRNARDALISAGAPAVAAMIAHLRANEGDYRVRVGVAYALAGMLRKDDKARDKISAQLKPPDFELLQRLTADKDATVRLQATEFLYLLADSRSVDAAIKGVGDDTAAAANSALILKGAFSNVSAPEKKRIINELSNNTMSVKNPRSQQILDSFAK
jgi:hypothetical protein